MLSTNRVASPHRAGAGLTVAKVLLGLVTVALLTSFAGLAAFAALLMPFHAWMARRAGVAERAVWALLAGASLGMAAAIVAISLGAVSDGGVTYLAGVRG